jgi:hypothetical protein
MKGEKMFEVSKKRVVSPKPKKKKKKKIEKKHNKKRLVEKQLTISR